MNSPICKFDFNLSAATLALFSAFNLESSQSSSKDSVRQLMSTISSGGGIVSANIPHALLQWTVAPSGISLRNSTTAGHVCISSWLPAELLSNFEFNGRRQDNDNSQDARRFGESSTRFFDDQINEPVSFAIVLRDFIHCMKLYALQGAAVQRRSYISLSVELSPVPLLILYHSSGSDSSAHKDKSCFRLILTPNAIPFNSQLFFQPAEVEAGLEQNIAGEERSRKSRKKEMNRNEELREQPIWQYIIIKPQLLKYILSDLSPGSAKVLFKVYKTLSSFDSITEESTGDVPAWILSMGSASEVTSLQWKVHSSSPFVTGSHVVQDWSCAFTSSTLAPLAHAVQSSDACKLLWQNSAHANTMFAFYEFVDSTPERHGKKFVVRFDLQTCIYEND